MEAQHIKTYAKAVLTGKFVIINALETRKILSNFTVQPKELEKKF